jgi:hypothetical protein
MRWIRARGVLRISPSLFTRMMIMLESVAIGKWEDWKMVVAVDR